MSKQLPTSGFEWMTDDELDDWKHLTCFLGVDLVYPEDLHNRHNDYPPQSFRKYCSAISPMNTSASSSPS